MKLSVSVASVASVVCAVALAAAASSADARPASTGWYAEGGLGASGFLPSASEDAKIGPALDIRLGRDLFSWLSVGLYTATSSQRETVPAPPTGDWFQLYRGGGDVRIGGRFDRIALFVDGGVGVTIISSNVLDKVMITKPGTDYSVSFHAGAGAEYQLENRHYAIGLAADAFLEPQFASVKQLEGRMYLRYTY
jgi:opacity protein-like surface antigen